MMDNFREWFDSLLVRARKAGELAQKGYYFQAEVDAAQRLAQLGVNPDLADELSNSGNGYVREGALRYLRKRPGAGALNVAITRLNDWVPQVRSAAEAMYRDYLSEHRVEDLLACIEAIYGLQHKTRLNHDALLLETRALLLRQAYRSAYLRVFQVRRGKVARFMLGWLLTELDKREAVTAGLQHVDPSVRAQALAALPHLSSEEALGHATSALADRSASIRTKALQAVMKLPASNAERLAWCRELLLDVSPGPRDMARWYASQCGMDVRAFYEGLTSQYEAPPSILVATLSEAIRLKLDAAVPLAEHVLLHPRAMVRIMAIRLLLVQVPARQKELLERAWQDASQKLKRCMLGLVGREVLLDGDDLFGMARAAWLRGDARVATTLSETMGAWRRFELILDLSCHAETRDHALKQLLAINRYGLPSSFRPYPQEQSRLLTLLERPALQAELAAFPSLVEGLRKSGCWPASTLQ